MALQAQDGNSPKYPINAGVPQGTILGRTLFLPYINDIRDNVIHNINICADGSSFYAKFEQVFDLW